jgi:ABC-type Fe3+/spermidine/putrescine transport system ATPase subunit
MTVAHTSCELRGVHVRHGARAVLSDCTLALAKSVHTALLGPSGCGKSTVLRLLAGLEAPTDGAVFVNGARASEPGRILIPPSRRRIAMVFQDLGLWPSSTALDNVVMGLAGTGLSRPERRTRAMAALELCRVRELADRLPGTMSGGEQQRVAIARALAAEPAVLFLDEPFAGLDLVTKLDLLAEIERLARARALTVCLVTHDPTEAFALCTHAAVLDAGRIAQQGAWDALLTDPRSVTLKAFRAAHRGRLDD